jgi:LCP family protein required for cell wall assembly
VNGQGSEAAVAGGVPIGNGSDKTVSPRRAFAKFFLITFVCCVVGMTVGLGVWDSLLSQKPMMAKEDTVFDEPEMSPVGVTEDKLNILIPASGVFATDPDFTDSKRVNILLFGNTVNSSEAIGLTDTIMLGSFDPDTKRLDIISIPRDTYYERENYAYGGYLKINSVMETEGVKAACESIHDVLRGVPINYCAVINYDGVANIVEAIGGVPMDIPFNMHYTSQKHGLYIDLKKGEQRLNGEQAVQFLRFRSGYNDADIGRITAQQQFVRSAVKEAIGGNLPTVAQAVLDNVDSDLDIRAMLYILSNASGMSFDDVTGRMLPGTGEYINKLSFWVAADDEEVVRMMREVYTGEVIATGGAISPAAAGLE